MRSPVFQTRKAKGIKMAGAKKPPVLTDRILVV